MRVIATANQKGGVHKTTATRSIAAGLATFHNKKVLMIDMDPQSDLTDACGVDPNSLEKTIYDVLINEHPLDDVTIEIGENQWLAPASIDLSVAELELIALEGREIRLKAAIASKKKKYDFIIIDCPPSLSLLTVNALSACSEVFCPFTPEYSAVRALMQLEKSVQKTVKWTNKDCKVGGLICTCFSPTKIEKKILDSVRENYGELLFQTIIRKNVAFKEAVSNGKDIFAHAANSNGAHDYKDLCDEIIKKGARK